MKKLLSLTIACMLLLGALGICAYAEAAPLSADVYVTVINKGELVVTYEKITVTDTDSDGTLTINDALYCVHEAKYDGGVQAGYSYNTTGFITKFWGDTSGSFGYYLNNTFPMGLTETVKNGDCLTAFVYKDATTWSDKYSYFNTAEISVQNGDEATLTLNVISFDEHYNPAIEPMKDAIITVDGNRTEYKTDAEGKVTLKLTDAGKHTVSAVSDSVILVPPVCVVTVAAPVTEPATDTEDSTEATEADNTPSEKESGCKSSIAVIGISATAVAAIAAVASVKRKNEE